MEYRMEKGIFLPDLLGVSERWGLVLRPGQK